VLAVDDKSHNRKLTHDAFSAMPGTTAFRLFSDPLSGTIFFSFNHFQIFLDEYCTNLVTFVMILSRQFTQSVLCEGPRRSVRLGFPISSHSTFKPSPAKPCRIRTSENPRLQTLWNPHFQERFISADSKRLILAEWRFQPFYNQHLRAYSVSAENAGLIAPFGIRTYKKSSRNSFRIRTSKKQGGTASFACSALGGEGCHGQAGT
jgi:hypothetical protein